MVDVAMAAHFPNKKAQTHAGLRATWTGCIRRCSLSRLDGRQHTRPHFSKRTSLQYKLIARICCIADEKARVLDHVGNGRLQSAVGSGDARIVVEWLRSQLGAGAGPCTKAK